MDQSDPTQSDARHMEDSLHLALLVAHQLKTPVGAAGTLVKTLLGNYAGEMTARQKDLLARADKRIEEATTTVSRMLSIIRPDIGTEGFDEATEVTALLRRLQVRCMQEQAARNLSVTATINVEPAYLRISSAALAEALNALLVNAVKYTPDNGRINLQVDPVACEDAFVIMVEDSGIGIPEHQREQVFAPFFRAEGVEGSAVSGLGLGLAFVKALVDAAGGRVWADKSALGGARFSIVLPRAVETAPAPQYRDADNNRMRVVIVGGVAAGPKVASKIIRMRPETAVTIIEREDFLAYAGCGLPYYISGVVQEQRELMATPLGCVRDPVFFHNVKNVRVLNRTEALQIDRQAKRVQIRDMTTEQVNWIDYDRLVLTTGATNVRPALPGMHLKNIFTRHGVHDAEGIKAHVTAGKARDVVILGGGLIGVETTEALVACGCRVTIVEQSDQILRMLDPEIAGLVVNHMESKGVRVMCNTTAQEITGAEYVRGVVTDRGTVPADMVIMAVGVRPEVRLAREAGLVIGTTGAIKVDSRMQTSDPDIFAAGDCVESTYILTGAPTYVPLGSTANKQGRVAAVSICGGEEHFPGVLGSTVCKVFDFCVGRTGITEFDARNAGMDVVIGLCGSPDREHFMPDARILMLKIVVDRTSRRLLGVQAIGPGDGAKRIDVAATAITAGMTVDQVANLDLSYAPPYSLAMDNLITCANIVRNKLDGVFQSINPLEVHRLMTQRRDMVLLDVSSPQEYAAERLPGSILIPSGALRGRLNELPRDKEIVVFCRLSIRGYEAALMLQAAGFERVRVMDGGVVMWPFEKVYGMR